MIEQVFIKLTCESGEPVWIEHREIKTIAVMPTGLTRVAGWDVQETAQQILSKLQEMHEMEEQLGSN